MAAKMFLLLEDDDAEKKSIKSYYRNLEDRKYILRSLEKSLKESLETGRECWNSNNMLEFIINGKRINLKVHAKSYADENNNMIRILSVAFPIPEIEKFKNLEDNIPVGIFEFGTDQSLTYSNKKFDE